MSPQRLSAFTLGQGALGTVLLHGFLGSGKNLRTLANKWLERQPNQTLLLPDLLGHGDSPPLPADATLDDVARAVLATASLLPHPLRLVGHSLGGRVALACARVAPERVADVVLLDIGPGPIDTRTSESRQVLHIMMQAPDEADDRQVFRSFFLGKGLSAPLTEWILMNLRLDQGLYRWRIDRRALDALHETFTQDDLWPVVESGEVPVHCALGERSRYVSAAEAQRLRAAGCDVHVLPGAGHYVHVDALGPLVDWLAQLP
ncbi:MAG: alpha/beta fold hydrolase [Myxococcales bacterium]|nr:alpha/beta fold hydrolase [Myxococcales bacterium]